MEGKTGMDLENAVRRWEDTASRGGGACKDRTRTGKEDGDEHGEVALANEVETHEMVVSSARPEALDPINDLASTRANRCDGYTLPQTRALTPDASRGDRFRIPLTGMFKRSLSAPAGQSTPDQVSSHHRQSSLDSVFANVSYDISESQHAPSLGAEQTEDLANAVSADAIGCLSPLVLPSILREGVPARWNDVSKLITYRLSTFICQARNYYSRTISLRHR